jgi:lipoate---protein ligase
MRKHESPSTACAEQLWNESQLEHSFAAPVLRLWRYDAPAVVLGCSQRRLLATIVDSSGLPVLLRGSGGGAVLVGPWMLGLSVALPTGHPLVQAGPVPTYRWLGEALTRVLRRFDVDAVALPPAALGDRRPVESLDWACYGGLSPWEVVAGDRKIVGLAQVRRRHGVLLVGGLLLDEPGWQQLCHVLGRPLEQADTLRHCTTSYRAETGRDAPIDELTAAIERELVNAWHGAVPFHESRPMRRSELAGATA